MHHFKLTRTRKPSRSAQRSADHSFAGLLLSFILLGSPLLAQESASPFSVRDLENNSFALEELRGKTVVLNFWFVQCRPCVQEMPELNELVQEYQDKKVVFLAFALNGNAELEQFLKKKDFNYQIIPDARVVAEQYSVEGFPTHIIIDKAGKVVYRTMGLGLGCSICRATHVTFLGT